MLGKFSFEEYIQIFELHSQIEIMSRTKKAKQRNKQKQQNKQIDRVQPGYIPEDFIKYYQKQFVPNTLSKEEFDSFISTYRVTLPHVFRLMTNSPDYPQVREELEQHIKKLKEMGFDASILDYIDKSYGVICKLSISKPEMKKNSNLSTFRNWLHMHTEVGDVTRQEFVSMLPPLFLNTESNHKVIDMCAAPGSKTIQILEKLNSSNDEEGFIIANDADFKRCGTLIHQLNRINTSKVLILNLPAQYIPDMGVEFDRALCDVPCSGDGTFRKNPDATKAWSIRKGCGLHSIQRSILIRALQMLKIGGICVYSTCSLNPIEDEAVINSVLHEVNKNINDESKMPVTIVDCSSKFPGLNRSNGMKTWNVYSDTDKKYEKYDDVPEDLRKQIRETMFPMNVTDSITRCMRFFPHQNDSGGFFVTVLQKNAPFEVRVENTQNASNKHKKDAPFTPLHDVEDGQNIINHIINDYGIDDDQTKFSSNLFARTENQAKTIFYLSKPLTEIINRIPSQKLQTVACGTRIFSYKSLNDENAVNAFPCFEGIDTLKNVATKRIVSITPADLKATFKAGNDGLQFSEMSQKDSDELSKLPIGGLIVKCEGTNLVYSGMKRKSNLTLQVKKERIKQEILKLVNLFPELADKNEEEDTNDDDNESSNKENDNDNE